MRTKVAVDLDGVLINLQDKLVSFHNRRYGTNTRTEEIVHYDLDDIWKVGEEEFIRRIMEFYRSQEFSEVEPIEGAVSGVEELSREFDLIVITARPPEIETATISEISRHFPGKFKEVILTDSLSLDSKWRGKADICLDRGVEIAVDDFYRNVQECASKGIYSILFDAPWNREHEFLENGIARARNWKEVVELSRRYALRTR